MHRQRTSPQLIFRLIFTCCIVLPGASAFSSTVATPVAEACALLKAADLKPLFGRKPVAKGNESSCLWTASGSKKNLTVVTYKKIVGAPTDIGFESALRSAVKRGQVNNEHGLGDKAFASIEPSGVTLVILKQGRLLQLQYRTEAAGTTKDIEALRPLAKKALVAY